MRKTTGRIGPAKAVSESEAAGTPPSALVRTLTTTLPRQPHRVVRSRPEICAGPAKPKVRLMALDVFMLDAGGIGRRSWT